MGNADISVTAKAVNGYLISGFRVYDSENDEVLRSVCDEAVPSLDIHITAETLSTGGEFNCIHQRSQFPLFQHNGGAGLLI